MKMLKKLSRSLTIIFSYQFEYKKNLHKTSHLTLLLKYILNFTRSRVGVQIWFWSHRYIRIILRRYKSNFHISSKLSIFSIYKLKVRFRLCALLMCICTLFIWLQCYKIWTRSPAVHVKSPNIQPHSYYWSTLQMCQH